MHPRPRPVVRVLTVIALLPVLPACWAESTGPDTPVDRIVLEASSVNVPPGGDLAMRAVLTDAQGRELSGRRIEWESSESSVATVSADGVARGVAGGVTTITARAEGVEVSADLSVAPAYEGGVLTLESVEGGPVHVYTPAFGGAHMEISTLTVSGDTLPGVTLRYTEVDGAAILTVAPDDPGLLPDLMWASPHRIGRQVEAPEPGFRITGTDAPITGPTWLEVRVFPRPVTPDSDFLTQGQQFLLTFLWSLQSSGGPCMVPGELADSVRGIVAEAASGGRGRRVVMSVGTQHTPGGTAQSPRLLNPDLAREGHALYLDEERLRTIADANSSLGTAGRAVYWTEELSGEMTGGEPWTLVALHTGDDYCNGELPGRLMSGREEPLSGPPGGVGGVGFQVLSDFGEPVSGVTVAFEVTEGGGFVDWETRVTARSNGGVSNRWTLGPDETRQTLVVTVLGEGGEHLDGVEGSPSTLSFIAREGPAWTDVEAGCGLRGQGELWCWGSRGLAGRTEESPRFRQLSAPFSGQGCGVSVEDRGYCWGYNGNGELGNGTTVHSDVPVPVSGGLALASVARGDAHSCGVTLSGKAYCWGRNVAGQVGDGTREQRLVPVALRGELAIASISAGGHHSCGVTTDGRAYCWGEFRRLGIGSDTTAWELGPLEVRGGLDLAEVSAGSFHTCALTTDGRAYCWGWEREGALGNGAASDSTRYEPVVVVGGLRFRSIGVGVLFACALTEGGQAYCWGDGEQGRLGNGSTTDRTEPTPVAGGHTFLDLGVSRWGGCGLADGGEVWCWGGAGGSPALEPVRIGEAW